MTERKKRRKPSNPVSDENGQGMPDNTAVGADGDRTLSERQVRYYCEEMERFPWRYYPLYIVAPCMGIGREMLRILIVEMKAPTLGGRKANVHELRDWLRTPAVREVVKFIKVT